MNGNFLKNSRRVISTGLLAATVFTGCADKQPEAIAVHDAQTLAALQAEIKPVAVELASKAIDSYLHHTKNGFVAGPNSDTNQITLFSESYPPTGGGNITTVVLDTSGNKLDANKVKSVEIYNANCHDSACQSQDTIVLEAPVPPKDPNDPEDQPQWFASESGVIETNGTETNHVIDTVFNYAPLTTATVMAEEIVGLALNNFPRT